MTIATKEEERKALQKIKKMVAELGENSYLGTAFTGAFEIAEQNIDNDFALSTQGYIEMAFEADRKMRELKDEADMLKTELLNKITESENELAKCKAWLDNERKAHEETAKTLEETGDRANEYAEEAAVLRESLRAANLQVAGLKAKLYDYIIQTA